MIEGRQGDGLAALFRQARRAAIWLIGSGIAVFLCNLFFGLAVLLAVLAVAVLWLALLGDAIGDAWAARARGAMAAVPVLPMLAAMPVMALSLGWIVYWSHVLPSWVMVERHKSAFRHALSGAPVPAGVLGIERAAGRTAFLTHNGMLGAWRGIVHDPSGRMAAARGWGGGTVPRDVRYVFGSRTVWCQRLDGPWFHCHFD